MPFPGGDPGQSPAAAGPVPLGVSSGPAAAARRAAPPARPGSSILARTGRRASSRPHCDACGSAGGDSVILGKVLIRRHVLIRVLIRRQGAYSQAPAYSARLTLRRGPQPRAPHVRRFAKCVAGRVFSGLCRSEILYGLAFRCMPRRTGVDNAEKRDTCIVPSQTVRIDQAVNAHNSMAPATLSYL